MVVAAIRPKPLLLVERLILFFNKLLAVLGLQGRLHDEMESDVDGGSDGNQPGRGAGASRDQTHPDG